MLRFESQSSAPMADGGQDTPAAQGGKKRNCDFLLSLVEGYKLFHVQTFPYNDLRGILSVISETNDGFVPVANQDTLVELNRYIHDHRRSDIQLLPIHSDVRIYQTAKYVLVYIKDQPGRHSAVVVFRVTNTKTTAPYCKETSALLEVTKCWISHKVTLNEFLPTFAARPHQEIIPLPQCDHPVLDVHQPERYANLAKHRTCASSVDSYNREYVDLTTCQVPVNPWRIYPIPAGLHCTTDLEELIQDPCKALGRGGFGVTVKVSDVLVAKVNMFPEMTDWSVPFIEDQFYRYAHIASQVEEILIGVSIKHPNILRTFGGYWCDIPWYPLGGRAVIVMEKALFSLQEFMCRMNRDLQPGAPRHTAVIPIVDSIRYKAWSTCTRESYNTETSRTETSWYATSLAGPRCRWRLRSVILGHVPTTPPRTNNGEIGSTWHPNYFGV